jgi:hypothetical protein
LVKPYGIYVSQLIISMFLLSWEQSKSFISWLIADDTNGTETAYPSGKPEFTPVLFSSLFCVEFVLSLIFFCLAWIVDHMLLLSVPFSFAYGIFYPFSTDYPIGIFKVANCFMEYIVGTDCTVMCLFTL